MRHLELHMLQSVPVACLNRDDLGSPKTAFFGGVQRARVSSQCWKRAVRELAQELLPARFQGQRTRLLIAPLKEALVNLGQESDIALANAQKIAGELATLDTKKPDTHVKTLLFTTHTELQTIASAFAAVPNMKKAIKSLGKAVCHDAADIALFGRMVASAHELTLEGAAMFAHALSTHKVDNEIDFFSALDDLQSDDESGAGMTGTLEFNAATYYRFAALNLDMLADDAHLGGLPLEERQNVVATFVEATLKAMPGARKNSMNANTLPAYVLCVLRDTGHPVQLVNAFERPVCSLKGNGHVQASIEAMKKEYEYLENTWGIKAAYVLVMPEKSLSDLLQGVREHVR